MLNKILSLIMLVLGFAAGPTWGKQKAMHFTTAGNRIGAAQNEYVVLVAENTLKDAQWKSVAFELRRIHHAILLSYDKSPNELLDKLKEVKPRYVATVARPEEINKDYIVNMHQLSRKLDNDVFADFLWGVVTGYTPASAMKMVKNAEKPLVVKSAISTITDLKSAKWFDRYAWLDDIKAGLYGEKRYIGDAVTTTTLPKEQVASKFCEMYSKFDPDLVLTGSHASQNDLQIPFAHNVGVAATLLPKDGNIYVKNSVTNEEYLLKGSNKPRIYLPIANCLIGDVDNSKNSMAITWMNNSNIAAYVGYVVSTWYGRNGWGGLKYWLTTPGRYTVAQAMYLNQQDMLAHLSNWEMYSQISSPRRLGEGDKKGFEYDRDVLAYYGDPKWNARLQQISEEDDFTVGVKVSGKKCVVTIKTKQGFSAERLSGNHFKEAHVQNLPFSYFFPNRIKNPRLTKGQNLTVVVDENFMLLYNPGFEPGKTYEILLDVD